MLETQSPSVASPHRAVRTARFALAAGLVAVLVGVFGARIATEHAWIVFWDNWHWTSGYAAAAVLAWIGWRSASPRDRATRGWFTLGAASYTLGQIAWDVQVATGWNPFPGPSDCFFVLLGPCFAVGLLLMLRGRLSPGESWAFRLDVLGLAVAVLTLTLVLYLPRIESASWLTNPVLVAYPVFLLSATAIAILTVFSLRLAPRSGTVCVVAGLLVDGVLWMVWNSLTLDNALADGTVYNTIFSFTALVLGWGACHWTAEERTDARYQRLCFGLLRLQPILLVILAAIALAFGTELPPLTSVVVDLGAGLVVAIAIARQSLLLRERDQLLATERALRESQSKLREIASASTDAIFLVAVGANGEFIFEVVNPAIERLVGRPAGRILYQPIASVFPPAEAELATAHYRECLVAERSIAYREKLVTDAGMREFHTVLTPMRAECGRFRWIMGISRDMTDALRAEAEIRALNATLERRVEDRTRELADAVNELEAFSYTVSHDLRAPLRSIEGFSQIVLHEYGERMDEEGRSMIQRAARAARRMSELIDSLLRLSRMARAAPRREPVDVSAMASEVAAELREQEPERSVTVRVQAGMQANADAGLLRVVLQNLIGNAWKFTRARSGAEIAITMTECLGEREFTVADDGIGFDMSQAKLLFTAFQRLHTSDDYPGTGIGLATVHRIVTRHGGSIRAEARPGEGARFTFTLEPQVMEPSPGAHEELEGARRTVAS